MQPDPDNVYLALTGQKPWTNPEFVDAIELLNTMQENGWFMGGWIATTRPLAMNVLPR